MEAVPRPQVGCGTGAFWPSGAAVTIGTASGARQMYVKLPAHPGPGSRMSGHLDPCANRDSPRSPIPGTDGPLLCDQGGRGFPATGPVPGRVHASRRPMFPPTGLSGAGHTIRRCRGLSEPSRWGDHVQWDQLPWQGGSLVKLEVGPVCAGPRGYTLWDRERDQLHTGTRAMARQPQLARHMPEQALDAGLSTAWMTGDTVYDPRANCAAGRGPWTVSGMGGTRYGRCTGPVSGTGLVPDRASAFPTRQHRSGSWAGLVA